MDVAIELLCRFIHIVMDKPFEGGAVSGAFSLDDSRNARRRMFELRFYGAFVM